MRPGLGPALTEEADPATTLPTACLRKHVLQFSHNLTYSPYRSASLLLSVRAVQCIVLCLLYYSTSRSVPDAQRLHPLWLGLSSFAAQELYDGMWEMHEAHFSHTIICKGERRRRGLICTGLCNARPKRGSRGRLPPCGARGVPRPNSSFRAWRGANYIALVICKGACSFYIYRL